MIKTLFLTFTLFLFNCFVSHSSVIIENNDSYLVRSVMVEGASFESEQSVKQDALKQAKQIAFDDLLKHFKLKDISFDETNINAMISSYTVVDEYYNENFYTLIANFVFNKAIFQSFLKNKNESTNKSIVNCVVKIQEQNDIIDEYVKLRDFLKKEKIVFLPQEFSSTEISILLKNVNKNKIYDSLKMLNLNGQLYVVE